jgi:hypothetical protein
MTDTVILDGGITDDQTPEVRIVLDAPLWGGAVLVIFRNGEEIGQATLVSPTEYTFTDNLTDGEYTYTAQVVLGPEYTNSNSFSITVSSPDVSPPVPTIVQIINDDEEVGSLPTPIIIGVEGTI